MIGRSTKQISAHLNIGHVRAEYRRHCFVPRDTRDDIEPLVTVEKDA